MLGRECARWLLLSVVLGVFSLGMIGSAGAKPASAADDAYRIGPEDVLQISVWREEGLDREVVVRPDGRISFPLAGDIQVGGRPVNEVEKALTERIRNYIPEAVVSVSVVEVSGYRVFVLGRVNNPGPFTVGRYVDVMQALTLAGGLTPFASERGIKVIRRSEGGEEVHAFNYSDVKNGRRLDQNIVLRSGDVVVVP
jgi:polysaccharide biosynthesis/export protein